MAKRMRPWCHVQDEAAAVTNSTLQTELNQVQLMIQHMSNFTSGQSNPVYSLITKQVNFHYGSYMASCAPLYCDITQVTQSSSLYLS